MTSLRSGSRTGKRPRRRGSGPDAGAREEDGRAVRQGLSILGVLALVAAAIFFLDPIQRRLAAGPQLVVTAPRARGLETGAQVWVAGTKAGRVVSVQFRPPEVGARSRVVVRATLHEEAAPHLRRGARAWIQPAALLAPTVLVIAPGPPENDPFDFGDTIQVEERVTAEELLHRARETRRGLEQLHAAGQEVMRRLEEGTGTLALLRGDTALRRTLRSDLAGLRRTAAALRGEPPFARILEAAEGGRLDSLLARGRRAGEVLAGRRDAVDALAGSLSGLERRLRRLDSLTAAGHGTVGRLRADGELRAQLRQLADDLARTRAELRAHPFRWLRIRLF